MQVGYNFRFRGRKTNYLVNFVTYLQPSDQGSTRSSRRRASRLAKLDDECSETVFVLNTLSSHTDPSLWPSFCESESQRQVLSRIRALHASRKWPAGIVLESRAALKRTLRHSATSYDQVEGVGSLCSCEPGCVSLPRDDDPHCQLRDVLPESWGDQVEDFSRSLLRPPIEMADLLDDVEGGPNSYHDPSFTDPDTWAEFVKELFECGLITFTTCPRVINGVFVVSKTAKAGAKRLLMMILDCRAANRLFRQPPSTLLCGIEAMARLRMPSRSDGVTRRPCDDVGDSAIDGEAGDGDPSLDASVGDDCLFVSQEDVCDLFY